MIKSWYSIDVETHLNWDIKISRLWKYIKFTSSFDRPERKHKLMTTSVYKEKEISLKSDISTLTQEVTF
jgi:hypothetical protein